jgi:hypothetical protein
MDYLQAKCSVLFPRRWRFLQAGGPHQREKYTPVTRSTIKHLLNDLRFTLTRLWQWDPIEISLGEFAREYVLIESSAGTDVGGLNNPNTRNSRQLGL